MANEKEEVEALLKSLPGNSADEDVQYRRYVLEKIRLGLVSAETQPTFTQEQAEARLRTWLTSAASGGTRLNLSS